MRKIIHIIFAATVLAFIMPDFNADAALRRRKKDKTEEVKDTVPPETPYRKFLEKKGTETATGFVNIYRQGKELYLEIPDSMLGRKVVMSSRIEESSDPMVSPGTEISRNTVYIIDRTDSLVLLRRTAKNIVIEDGDPSILKALGEREAVAAAFPIRYRNEDSTAVVIKATSLFSLSDRKNANLNGKAYADYTISGASHKSDLLLCRGIRSFGNSVGVLNEATFELSLAIAGLGFESAKKPMFTATILTTVNLLPEERMPVRKADSRVGTRKTAYTSFSADGGSESGYWASRWFVQPADTAAYFSGKGSETAEPIRIYVDTLFSYSWTRAITEGIMAWAPAFEAIGLKNAITVEPYPSDGSFRADSPLTSCVAWAGGSGETVSGTLLPDATTGRIMSCRITVPGNFAVGAYKDAVFSISDVDTRYQSYFLPDDAICEVLKARIMRIFGLCLGLSSNYAGSMAYSPEQLRDPEFTSEHGITASVTDDVLFNYMARPGDKEKGVKTIVDRIGPYDMSAVEWLYRPFRADEEQALDSLLASMDGNPEYLYISDTNSDPRAKKYDLGNDDLAACEAGMSHLRFVAANADKWIDDERIPQAFKDLFIDWLWLRFNGLNGMLSYNIGAMMTNDIRSSLPKISTVPENIQRKALETIFGNISDMSWIDSNRELIHFGGAYRDVGAFTTANFLTTIRLVQRLPYVIMAEDAAGSEYTASEYLSDLHSLIMAGAARGDMSAPSCDLMVAQYISFLIGYSDIMHRNYTEARSKGKTALSDISFRVEIDGVPISYADSLEEYCYNALQKVRQTLISGKNAARTSFDRRKIDFLLSLAEAGLGIGK